MFDIKIDSSQLIEAAEQLASDRCDCADIPSYAIAEVISSHLESLIYEALNDPQDFFRDPYSFWQDLNRVGASGETNEQAA